MAATLAHRGPDADGFYDSPFCSLGHRRLSIIDLSEHGRQPMANEDGSVQLSFNGEIYNYLDLIGDLQKKGHRFRGRSDTEVIVHLYEELGAECLTRLNGMFGLAIWDQPHRRLLLARDRFGKKPVYYCQQDGRFLFASELKALLVDPRVPRELDPDALALYLALGYVPGHRTIFKHVAKLPPASSLTVTVGGDGTLAVSSPQTYWRLRFEPDTRLTEDTCVETIRSLIGDAVRIRMFSDVPLGAFLSGGIDSSAVVAYMAAASERPVETFSIAFEEGTHDESPFAEMVARQYRTNHHTLHCRPDALEVLPTLVHHYDEPFADSSAIPTYYVSKIAREFVTVVLSGDGGDEVFAGYTRYDNGMMRSKLARFLPEPLIRAGFRAAREMYPVGWRGWGILHRNSMAPLDSYMADVSLFHRPESNAILNAPWRTAAQDASPFAIARALAAKAGDTHPLSQMQFVDQMLYLPDDILVKVDRASMAVSLETRAPLLDYRIAEFMATVPAPLRYRNSVKKYLLKKALGGLLPDEILHRRKMGFGVPLESWFRGSARLFARETLLSRQTRERGVFDPREVERLFDRHEAGGRDFSAKIWTTLFFELWCRHWLDVPPA